MDYSLIANTGIHMTTFPKEINIREKFTLWFHEWYDTSDGDMDTAVGGTAHDTCCHRGS